MAKRPRRVFSAAEKLRIVQEADGCLASGKRGALEAMLRREAIYSSLLSSWRTELGAHGATGLAPKKAGRKPKLTEAERINLALTKRNSELERKLHLANALIALQKKRTNFWDWHFPRARTTSDGPRRRLRCARRVDGRRLRGAGSEPRDALSNDLAAAVAYVASAA